MEPDKEKKVSEHLHYLKMLSVCTVLQPEFRSAAQFAVRIIEQGQGMAAGLEIALFEAK